MDMTEVTSSHVSHIGYDPETKILRVRYHSRVVYEKPDVSAEDHAALMLSNSKGSYLRRHVYGPTYRRVSP